MKLSILTSPVSPASQDISRTLLPLQPAANPILGESAPSQTSPQLQEALLLSFPSSWLHMFSWPFSDHVFLEHQVPRRTARAHSPVSFTDVRPRVSWRWLQAAPALTPSVEIHQSQVRGGAEVQKAGSGGNASSSSSRKTGKCASFLPGLGRERNIPSKAIGRGWHSGRVLAWDA